MRPRSIPAQLLGLAACLAVAFLTAGIGAIASIDAAGFYAQLNRPSWAPPGSLFAPVWSTLYTMMGFAAWLVWRQQHNKGVAVALTVFLVQLCANALWSWLFFAWHNGAGAFGEVLVLLALIAATIITFWRVSRLAAILLLPYFAWVCFASALTWSVWRNNPTLL
jgi:benzodiazapine receptor